MFEDILWHASTGLLQIAQGTKPKASLRNPQGWDWNEKLMWRWDKEKVYEIPRQRLRQPETNQKYHKTPLVNVHPVYLHHGPKTRKNTSICSSPLVTLVLLDSLTHSKCGQLSWKIMKVYIQWNRGSSLLARKEPVRPQCSGLALFVQNFLM